MRLFALLTIVFLSAYILSEIYNLLNLASRKYSWKLNISLFSSDILPLIDLVQVIKANKVTVNLHLPHRFYYYLLSCILTPDLTGIFVAGFLYSCQKNKNETALFTS